MDDKLSNNHHAQGHAGHWNPYLLAGLGMTSAVTLAPYLLPLLGIGKSYDAVSIMHFIGGEPVLDAATGIAASSGNGLAGSLAAGLAHIPLLGPLFAATAEVTIPGLGWTVAAGTLASLAATATIGIGGVLLANWLERREAPDTPLPWSKIIRYTALATSTLIALPGILSGVSVGLSFLALTLLGGTALTSTMIAMRSTLGATSMVSGAASSVLAMTLPHLISCGSALLPLVAGFFLGREHEAAPIVPVAEAQAARMELVPAPPTTAGSPVTVAFRLVDARSGRALTPAALAVTHTEKLHAMLVDQSLSDYRHLHPSFDAATGLFTCQFTPASDQPYRFWLDFTRVDGPAPTVLRVDLPARNARRVLPSIQPTQTASAGGLTLQLASDAPLEAGKPGLLNVQVTDATGKPAVLQPIMGADAHLVGFTRDNARMVHAHPLEIPGGAISGLLQFQLTPPQEGPTKFFLQLRTAQGDVVVPFGQQVRPARQFATRIAAEQQMPAHAHAMA